VAISIGSVKIDTNAKERSLEARYPALNNPAGLRILLSDYHALQERQYAGDYDATVILVDLATAIDKASLTGRQAEALRLVYEEDLTQEEAGRRMKISQQAVEQHVSKAVEAIADIYYYWSGHGEGYTVGITKGDD
jgi:RNA polymerase sigma factor (sigma-70 family)